MDTFLRLSDHPMSQQWLTQFHCSKDRACAMRLLNQLKLVSTREFESGIEQSLMDLQRKLNSSIAVYPISSPLPKDISSYDPFTGGFSKDADSKSINLGRRKRYGSEDRLGHLLTKLQQRFKRGEGASAIECQPTLEHLKSQGIRHIVLVDDVSGSGKRIKDYWKKVVPRSVKSLLSLKRFELWIVLYAITPNAETVIKHEIPNFPLFDHLITVLPKFDKQRLVTKDFLDLCSAYAQKIGVKTGGHGFQGSFCPIVFEHGCPNNTPEILWWAKRPSAWKALFPHGSIPFEMRNYFEVDGTERGIEILWQANQPKLALNLLEGLDQSSSLTTEQRMLFIFLGLSLRGVSEEQIVATLLLKNDEIRKLRTLARNMNLYDATTNKVTPIGKKLVSLYKQRFDRVTPKSIGISPEDYYPRQCEGKLQNLGKTSRSNARQVPLESQ